MHSRWLIGLDITDNYHYKMDAVSEDIPVGCPGTGSASDSTPTELKALTDESHR